MRKAPRPLASRRPARNAVSAEQLAALSHEFRTPLNGVLGMARLLEGTPLTPEQRAYAAALRESGEHLLGLVNDLLDFARLGAGRVELHAAAVDVEEVLRSVCELLSPRAAEKGLEIAWAVSGDLPRIRADEIRLRQILLNFAGNAVKFTQSGGVLLSVSAIGPRLRFTVEDTGPGVPDGDRARIFEAFAQAEAGQSQGGGAGLGLAIARRLARAMDGEVGVETAPEGGAAFWFEAPFEVLRGPKLHRPLAGLTVGLASPNPVVREGAAKQIRACGGTPVVAETLDALLPMTRLGDVLLIDRPLASAEAAPAGRSAIVLLSAADRDRLGAWREAGFAGYLIKPVRCISLAERVLIGAGSEAAKASETLDDRVAPRSLAGARVLLVEDNLVNALLAKSLLVREGCEVDHARAGEEALAAVTVGAYDLILMDMRMPGLSGAETSQRLRAGGVSAPIVALTANAFDDDRQACLAAGMQDLLVKPLVAEALRAVLSRWAGWAWTPKATRAKVAQ